MTDRAPQLERRERLSPDEVRAVVRLVDDVTTSDGVRPLSEHVMLHLRYGGDVAARSLLLWDGDTLVGYAHLDTTDEVEGASAELAVRPDRRGRGHGRALVGAVAADAGPNGRLRLWSHGSNEAAAALAHSLGFVRERMLWQMRRSLYSPVDEPGWPSGVTVRTFVVGQDEAAWLEVNNRAFAEHPDQGKWSAGDLEMR